MKVKVIKIPDSHSEESISYIKQTFGKELKKGGGLSEEKARKILHDKSVRGHALTDKQRRFFGAVASGYIKENGGYLECGGKMYYKGGKYQDGSDIDFEDDDLEALDGELEEVSENVVEVKGKDHDQGGVKLNTGDEVEGGETIDTEKKIVYSDTLIDPVTKKTFAESHLVLAKQMKSLEKGTENWEKKKLEKLKKDATELYERQQEMNGGESSSKKQDGGGLGEEYRYFVKSDGSKSKIKSDDVTKIELWQKSNPGFKEVQVVNNQIVDLPQVEQKKNTGVQEKANQSNKTELSLDWDKIKPNPKSDNPMGQDSPILNIDEQGAVDYFKNRNKDIQEIKSKFIKDSNYNDVIESKIKENRSNVISNITDPLGLWTSKPEGNDLIDAGAREARNYDNNVVINTIIPELKKRETKFVDYSKLNEDEIVKENVENSEVFRNSLDNLKEKYKGIKLKRPDGTELDTDKITDSQWSEIRNGVINNYQVKTKWDANVEKLKTSTENALKGIGTNPELADFDPTAKFIKEQGIDKGLIPISEDQWASFYNKSEKLHEKYTPLITNLKDVISKDNAAFKSAYENASAELTHKLEPEVLAKKTELETLVSNQQLSPEDATKQWDEFQGQIKQQQTQLFEDWNKKINQNSQIKLKEVEDSIHGELKDALKGTIFENIDLGKVDSKYVENSLNAFMQLAGSFTENDLARSERFLKDNKTKIYNYNDYGQQFGVEMQRGVLQIAEGIGGFVSFMGGYEAGNEVNDVVAQFNQNNPQYEMGHFEFNKLMNPDYWIAVVGPMVGQQLIMAPLAITGAGLGAAVAGEAGLGTLGAMVARGVGGAMVTRPINSMVNSGSYYNQLIANGAPVEEAAKKAADDFTFQMSLIGLDAVQIGAGFSNIGNIFKIGKIGGVATKVIGGSATEGVEEVLEGYPERDDPFQTLFDYATSDIGVDQLTGGAMGGLVMGGVTSVPDLAARNTNNTKKFLENLTYDMMSGPDMGKRYQDLKLTIDSLLERKILNPKEYEQANKTLDFAYSKGKEIPVNLPPAERHQILSYLSDVNQWEQLKANATDQTLIKTYDGKIKELQKKVDSTMSGKEAMYFIGRVPYSKEQFNEQIQNPEVFQQILDHQTSFDVINDDKVLNQTNDLINQYEDSKNKERTTDSIPEERTLDKGQLDIRGISEENASTNQAENQYGETETDVEETPFPEYDNYTEQEYTGPTNFDRKLYEVSEYAKDKNLPLTEDEIQEVASVLDDNPNYKIEDAIEEITSPILYETENGRYQYVQMEDGIKMIDSSGNEAKLSSNQKLKYDKEFGKNAILTQENEQLLNEYFKEEEIKDINGTKDDAIAELLKNGITEENFNSIADRKTIEDSKNKGKKSPYLNDKSGPIDTRIQEINEIYFNGNSEIAEDDIADFISRYPQGVNNREKQLSKNAANLAITFKEKTGISIEHFRNRQPKNERVKNKPKEFEKNIPLSEEEKTYTEMAKKLADKVRKLKTPKRKLIIQDENGNDIEVNITTNDFWSETVEIAALAIEQTGKIADGVKAAIKNAKTKEWYKKLTEDQQISVDEQIRSHIRTAIKKKKQPQGTTQFLSTVQSAEKVSEQTKTEFEKKAQYEIKTVKQLSDNANKAWKEIQDNTSSKEEAINLAEKAIRSRDWEGDESEQAALAGIVAKEMFDLRQGKDITLEQINDYDKRAADLLDLVSKALTKNAQFTSRVGKFMAEMLMAYPEGITQQVQKTIDSFNDGSFPVNDTTVKTMEGIFNELLNNEDGKRILRDYAVREGLIKQKYKSKKEAVDAYLDNWLSTSTGGTLQSSPGPAALFGDILRGAVKLAAKTTLTIAEKVELTISKIKEKYKEKFDEAKLRAQLEHIFKDAEKFGDDWEKGKLGKNENAVKTVKERIEEEYQKRIKTAQNKLAKEKEEINSESKEVNDAVKERLDADKKLREFEEGLKQLNGDKLKNLVEKVAKDFVNGKGKFTSDEIKRGIQQVNGGFGLTQRQMGIIDKNSKTIIDINKKIRDNDNLTQQQIITLNHQALQASSQIMRMLTKRNWLDILHGAKIAGYFTAKTLESNLAGNFVSRLFHKAMDLVTSPIDILIEPSTMRKGNYVQRVQERLNEKFGKKRLGTAKEEIKTIVPALKIAYDIIKHGTPHGEIGKVPSNYDLKPIEAWRSWSDQVSKNPNKLKAINEAVKIGFEGTIGFYSAFMLRNLGAGDVITRIPELAIIQKRMADYLNVPFNLFLTDDQFKEWREDAEELSSAATYQQENLALNFIGMVGKKAVGQNKSVEQARKVISTFLTSSIIPFTKTPVNLASEVFKLIPGIAVPEFIWHTKQAYNTNLNESKRYYHQKLAQRNLKYTAISIPLFAAVKALIDSGILSFPSPPEREKKKRGFLMNYVGAPGKMEINLPGIETVVFDVQKFGPVGMYLKMVDETLKTKDSNSMLELVAHMLESAPAGLLENTFFTGINNIMSSIRTREGETDWRKISMDVFGPNSNIVLPNILADFTKLMDDEKYVRLLKDEDFITEFYNRNIRNKIGFLPFEGVESEGLKPKYNIWGEPIKTDSKNQLDWFHYLFDFTRSEEVDPEQEKHFFIYKNYMESKDQDWIPPVAGKDFKYEYVENEEKKKISVKLTENLVNEYQKVLGQSNSNEIDKLWSEEAKSFWSEGQTEPTLKQVQKAYDRGQKHAKKQFYAEYKDQLEKLIKKK